MQVHIQNDGPVTIELNSPPPKQVQAFFIVLPVARFGPDERPTRAAGPAILRKFYQDLCGWARASVLLVSSLDCNQFATLHLVPAAFIATGSL